VCAYRFLVGGVVLGISVVMVIYGNEGGKELKIKLYVVVCYIMICCHMIFCHVALLFLLLYKLCAS